MVRGRDPFFFQVLTDRQMWITISFSIFAGSSLLSSGAYGNATNSPAPSQQQGLRKLRIFAKLLDTPPGVYTQYKPFLQKDKNVIRNLLAGVKKQRPAEVQSAILRRHLLELTQSFMIPLERYMASLMPLQKGKRDLRWTWCDDWWLNPSHSNDLMFFQIYPHSARHRLPTISNQIDFWPPSNNQDHIWRHRSRATGVGCTSVSFVHRISAIGTRADTKSSPKPYNICKCKLSRMR